MRFDYTTFIYYIVAILDVAQAGEYHFPQSFLLLLLPHFNIITCYV